MHRQRWRSNSVRLVYPEIPPHTQSLHLKYSVYIVVAPLDVTEQSYGVPPHALPQDKGSIFCRDHTQDKPLHVATTGELPSTIIIVELLKERKDVMVHDRAALHDTKGVEILNDEPKCRVYRLTLHEDESDDLSTTISLYLATAAMMVAADECKGEITTADDLKADTKKLSLQIADDAQLAAGLFTMKAIAKTQFGLTEIY
ncbi:hypothetical protein PRIC2_002210 [Phytophthora ramorum]